jgi:integrase
MQHGSIIQATRKQGPDVWQFRWSEKDRNGRRIYRKRVIGTVRATRKQRAMRLTLCWPISTLGPARTAGAK